MIFLILQNVEFIYHICTVQFYIFYMSYNTVFKHVSLEDDLDNL